MSWRIHELSEQAVARLKEVTSEMIVKEEKRGKLRAFQEVLKNRSDLTLEALLRSQHVQLEILVALKTGIPDFLMRADDIPLTDLAEIFLNFKCRNLNCRSALPVDECDCKFCLKKDGFCSTCMCLICSKFDMASNTCSWVGCDVCSHWCHTDCGLQNFSIRNGCSVTGTQGTSEMQFYCIACGHPSEMFGFVKDVFKVCASEWKAETMLKELEYVRRIFSVSSDARGKLLRDVATQLLARLQNGSSVVEIYNHIMGFLAESDSKYSNASKSSRSEPQALQKNKGDESNRAAGLNREAFQSKSVSLKNPSQTTNVRTFPMNTDRSPGSGGIWDSEVQMSGKNKPVIVDELESIVKIKQAEAQMFQKRADDARREAESLKRIALAKNEKIEEEFSARITKLHLAEAEDRRQQKLEELHGSILSNGFRFKKMEEVLKFISLSTVNAWCWLKHWTTSPWDLNGCHKATLEPKGGSLIWKGPQSSNHQANGFELKPELAFGSQGTSPPNWVLRRKSSSPVKCNLQLLARSVALTDCLSFLRETYLYKI
ncbi:hypothetical protein Nepgr_001872 [Nepenthes gracilis]|uniref:Uncharacterized protein n=1 Tax=Nepenthes gracilis TaxID=150966 RepID=A0AAD3RXX5_NEPGR|nr:hypothetical protein Nepgr_001872 [Nepenthes gracilis]